MGKALAHNCTFLSLLQSVENRHIAWISVLESIFRRRLPNNDDIIAR